MMLGVDNIIPHLRVMSIGTRIRAARMRLNMTQDRLGKIVGAEQPTVSGWEKDPSRQPGRPMIPRLAKALKVTPHYLEFGGAAEQDRNFLFDAHDTEHDDGAAEIDISLMTECIRMSMKAMVTKYGVDIPKGKFEDAADAAISAYLNYYRLKSSDENAA